MTAFFKEIEPFRGNGNENEKGQTLEEFLEEYDPYKYKNPCVTTDAVIFSCKRKVVDGEWKVLMVKRRNHPSIGWWALPGGFIELHENLEDTARRELTEETGVADLPMEQFAVYGNVTRDPRARIITSAYLSVVDEGQVKVQALKAILDASNVSGIMISNIMGYGNQKGHKQFYRSAEYSVNLLPKIKVETVVEPEVAEPLIRKIVEEIKTGAYGDGKIFVYEVQDAVRIRTGERGSAAL